MEIRDEIEKLLIKPFWDEYAGIHRHFIERCDVLAVLDKWKTVDEFVSKDAIDGTFLSLEGAEINPGDHVIILRRRNESSS